MIILDRVKEYLSLYQDCYLCYDGCHLSIERNSKGPYMTNPALIPETQTSPSTGVVAASEGHCDCWICQEVRAGTRKPFKNNSKPCIIEFKSPESEGIE